MNKLVDVLLDKKKQREDKPKHSSEKHENSHKDTKSKKKKERESSKDKQLHFAEVPPVANKSGPTRQHSYPSKPDDVFILDGGVQFSLREVQEIKNTLRTCRNESRITILNSLKVYEMDNILDEILKDEKNKAHPHPNSNPTSNPPQNQSPTSNPNSVSNPPQNPSAQTVGGFLSMKTKVKNEQPQPINSQLNSTPTTQANVLSNGSPTTLQKNVNTVPLNQATKDVNNLTHTSSFSFTSVDTSNKLGEPHTQTAIANTLTLSSSDNEEDDDEEAEGDDNMSTFRIVKNKKKKGHYKPHEIDDGFSTFRIRDDVDNDDDISSSMIIMKDPESASNTTAVPWANSNLPTAEGPDLAQTMASTAAKISKNNPRVEDWEVNIRALERGEWVEGMNEAAFKRWKGKERPTNPFLQNP
eukprot:TRINITY_DN2087_c1_g1_i1.p1 TRINITY_DN2087_c1_g1~~TRINITY_DN2087_c1_g1_i1.p1  ORF type:complete len:413 (+),score=106.11 TRINITY_DN2087_c1_g1_i1:52-1290(+)